MYTPCSPFLPLHPLSPLLPPPSVGQHRISIHVRSHFGSAGFDQVHIALTQSVVYHNGVGALAAAGSLCWALAILGRLRRFGPPVAAAATASSSTDTSADT